MNNEKSDYKKRLKTLWIISLALIPISLISYLFLFSAFFAGGMFMTDFVVINKTNTPVRFSPYGKIYTEETGSLPMYFNGSPYFPKIKRTRFLIEPNESKKITYDTDDSFFQGILIEADHFIKDCRQEDFKIINGKIVIGEIQSLPDADKVLTEKVFKFVYKNGLFYILFFIGVTNSFLILILKVIRKKKKEYGT